MGSFKQLPLRLAYAVTVRFAPTSTGLKNAAIHIANNDADENPYDINLSGTGVNSAPTVVANPARSVTVKVCAPLSPAM